MSAMDKREIRQDFAESRVVMEPLNGERERGGLKCSIESIFSSLMESTRKRIAGRGWCHVGQEWLGSRTIHAQSSGGSILGKAWLRCKSFRGSQLKELGFSATSLLELCLAQGEWAIYLCNIHAFSDRLELETSLDTTCPPALLFFISISYFKCCSQAGTWE